MGGLPFVGSWGGRILMIWDVDKIEVLEHELGPFSISLRCKLKGKSDEWVFAGVYDPNQREEVNVFLTELDDVKA